MNGKQIGRGALVAAAFVMAVAAALPAHADATIRIAGSNYLWHGTTAEPGAGHTGSVNGPDGRRRIGNGPVVAELGAIVNHDPIPHTFTLCLSNCDAPAPVWSTTVDFALAPLGGTANLAGHIRGTASFGCRIHPEMRGTITVTG